MGLKDVMDEGILELCDAIMHTFRKDIKNALRLKTEKYKQEQLNLLRIEAEKGLVGQILELMDVEYDSVVQSVQKEIDDEC